MKFKKIMLDFSESFLEMMILTGLIGVLAIGVGIVFTCFKVNSAIGILVIALIALMRNICKSRKGKTMKKVVLTEKNIESFGCSDLDEFNIILSALAQMTYDCKNSNSTNEQAAENLKQIILSGLNEIKEKKQ